MDSIPEDIPDELLPNTEFDRGEFIKCRREYIQIQQLINNTTVFTAGDIDVVLQHLCSFMLLLNGQSEKDSYIDNRSRCFFLGNDPHRVRGCKTDDYDFDEKKKFTMKFLSTIILVLFTKASTHNPDVVHDKKQIDVYFNSLLQTITLFCHFIGSKELGPINTFFGDLVENMNVIFYPHTILSIQCTKPTDYECGRAITSMESDDRIKQIVLVDSSVSNTHVFRGGKKSKSKSMSKSKTMSKSKSKSKSIKNKNIHK